MPNSSLANLDRYVKHNHCDYHSMQYGTPPILNQPPYFTYSIFSQFYKAYQWNARFIILLQ